MGTPREQRSEVSPGLMHKTGESVAWDYARTGRRRGRTRGEPCAGLPRLVRLLLCSSNYVYGWHVVLLSEPSQYRGQVPGLRGV